MQAYPTSKQAYAIRDNRTKQTEFEILREKYRKAQLEELQEQYGEEQISVEQPKIKIIRKKRPTTDNSTSLISPGVEPSSPVLNETAKAQATIAAANKQKTVAEQNDDAATFTPAAQPTQAEVVTTTKAVVPAAAAAPTRNKYCPSSNYNYNICACRI
ncbi:hypothetical protein P4S68_03540 [Pseudoalteromonas sp. Hal099]